MNTQRVYIPQLDTYFTLAQKELFDYVTKGAGGDQILQDLAQGKLKIETFADNIKVDITNFSGRREVLNQTSQAKFGRIPEVFNNGEFPEGTAIAVSHIRMAYATDATVTVPEGDVDYSAVPTGWPAALTNSLVIVSQSSAIKQQFASKYAGSQAAGFGAAIESDGLELGTPFVLEPKKTTKIELVFADAQAVPNTNKHFLEIGMLGAILRRKA